MAKKSSSGKVKFSGKKASASQAKASKKSSGTGGKKNSQAWRAYTGGDSEIPF